MDPMPGRSHIVTIGSFGCGYGVLSMVVSVTPVGAAPSSSSHTPLRALIKLDLPAPVSPVTAMFSGALSMFLRALLIAETAPGRFLSSRWDSIKVMVSSERILLSFLKFLKKISKLDDKS